MLRFASNSSEVLPGRELSRTRSTHIKSTSEPGTALVQLAFRCLQMANSFVGFLQYGESVIDMFLQFRD